MYVCVCVCIGGISMYAYICVRVRVRVCVCVYIYIAVGKYKRNDDSCKEILTDRKYTVRNNIVWGTRP